MNTNTNSTIRDQLFEYSNYSNYSSQHCLLACGGFADSTKGWGTCDRFDNGRWVQAYNLTNRWSHVSWTTEDGVYLIGGGFGAKTSDLLKRDGTVAQGFKLPQNMQ